MLFCSAQSKSEIAELNVIVPTYEICFELGYDTVDEHHRGCRIDCKMHRWWTDIVMYRVTVLAS